MRIDSLRMIALFSNPYRDGSTISTLETIKGLNEMGVQILVIVREEGFLTEVLRAEKIKYVILPLPFWQLPNKRNFIDTIKFLPRVVNLFITENKSLIKLNKLIKEWGPNVIYTNVSVIDIGYRAAKKNKLPHIWHIREYGDLDFDIIPLTGKKKWYNKLHKSYCICITKALKKYHKLGNNAQIIYNSIVNNCNEVNNSKVKKIQKDKVFLYVGRVTEKKGATEVITSFIDFASLNHEYTLDVLGRCQNLKYLNYLKTLVKSHGLENRVRFIGQVDNVGERMQKAKAIIVASESEGFGRITAEAMLNKCLVIGYDSAGTREQFDNGKALWSKEIGLRYRNHEELVAGMNTLANMKEEEYSDLLHYAFMTVEQLYNKHTHMEKIRCFIQSIFDHG